MTDDRVLLQEIGRLLWSIFDDRAEKIVLLADCYPEHHSNAVDFVREDGSVFWFEHERVPHPVLRQVMDLVRQLQKTPPFDREPFTHMRYALSDQGKMDVKFAYIPEWDSWPNLYMQGVSQVPEDKLNDHNIPDDVWAELRARFEKEPYTLPENA